MRIRGARLEDTPAMGRVMVDTYLAAHRGQVPEEAWRRRQAEWTYEVSAAAWARNLSEIAAGETPRTCLYVAEDVSGEIVGLAMGSPIGPEALTNLRGILDDPDRFGEVNALYVQQQCHRQGLGRRLVQAVAAHLARFGMDGLIIGCLVANATSRRFYEALGGRVVGERESDEYGFMVREVLYCWTDTGELVGTGGVGAEGGGR